MAGDSWWRFYNTALEHPKVLLLNDTQFRAWVALNCLASKLGGTIPPDMALIAMTLRKTPGKAAEIVQVLLSAVLLDPVDEGYRPHNWSEKQFKSDVSTERVKRFRDGKRNVSETPHSTETKPETERKKIAARMARFDEFWGKCPKKTGKGAAEKAWLKACDLADPDVLITSMAKYASTCAGKENTYIKTPGPWLNEKRWLDEESAVPASGGQAGLPFNLAEVQEIEEAHRRKKQQEESNVH